MDGLPGLKVRNISEIVFEIIMINNNSNNYVHGANRVTKEKEESKDYREPWYVICYA